MQKVSLLFAHVFSEYLTGIFGKHVTPDLFLRILEDVSQLTFVAWAQENNQLLGAALVSTRAVRYTIHTLLRMVRMLGLRTCLRARKRFKKFRAAFPKKMPRELFLELFAVTETHRGRGIGKMLLAEVERAVRAHGARWLGLTVHVGTPAVAFYEKQGYVRIKTFDSEIGTWIYMRKFLAEDVV